MITAVFVYGTLKRGQCRESMWPAQPVAVHEAFVRGSLFGRADYPAMISGDDCVVGELWRFTPSQIESVLHTLDEIEVVGQVGEVDLYHRVISEVFDLNQASLGKAMTYLYASDPIADGFALIKPTADGYVAWPAAV